MKAEIQAFEAGTADDTIRVYTYPTPLQTLATDDALPAADPRLQNWPGVKPAAASTATAAAPGNGIAPGNQPAAAADPTPTVQTYLQAFAEAANIWIMAPSTWDTEVANPPAPSSSIISAVKNFVSRSHGTIVQAIILRAGRGGRGGGGGFGDMDAMNDRLENAIIGLPDDARADAQAQLDQQVKFFQDVRSAPPDQQQQMMRNHMMEMIANAAENAGARRSPERMAKMFQMVVANRQSAQGSAAATGRGGGGRGGGGGGGRGGG